MKLPNADRATIPQAKLQLYLLSPTHPVGKSKARYFRAVGFEASHQQLLNDTLLDVARSAEVRELVTSPFGTKYVVEAAISTPVGNRVQVRTVWIIETGQQNPRLVTAYPL